MYDIYAHHDIATQSPVIISSKTPLIQRTARNLNDTDAVCSLNPVYASLKYAVIFSWPHTLFATSESKQVSPFLLALDSDDVVNISYTADLNAIYNDSISD